MLMANYLYRRYKWLNAKPTRQLEEATERHNIPTSEIEVPSSPAKLKPTSLRTPKNLPKATSSA